MSCACSAPWSRPCAYAGRMRVPAAEPPAYAESRAQRGALTHLTINGERVALIVPASLMDSLQILARLLVSDKARAALPALLPEGGRAGSAPPRPRRAGRTCAVRHLPAPWPPGGCCALTPGRR